METSDYGESEQEEDEEVPIWERNQSVPSLSFCIRVEDRSDLKGESNFVLINISDLYCSNKHNNFHINNNNNNYNINGQNNLFFSALNYNDTGSLIFDQQRAFDGEFEIL